MAGRDKFGKSPDIIIGSGGGVQWAVAALGKKNLRLVFLLALRARFRFLIMEW